MKSGYRLGRLLGTLLVAASLAGCGGAQGGADKPAAEQPAAEQNVTPQEANDTNETSVVILEEEAELADGTYEIEVETDSSMFRSEKCELTVENGEYTAELTLPGEGFSKLYFGSAEDAATAPVDEVYEYRLNDDGKYTFDLPVAALDEELPIAAYGQRRDTWYDHTIVFHAPVENASTEGNAVDAA